MHFQKYFISLSFSCQHESKFFLSLYIQLHFVSIHVVHQKLYLLCFIFKLHLWQYACKGIKYFLQYINTAGFYPMCLLMNLSFLMTSSSEQRKSNEYFQIISHVEIQNIVF